MELHNIGLASIKDRRSKNMSYGERLALYKELEKKRGRPLVVYVTSARQGCEGSIAGDAIRELTFQLEALPAGTKSLDLLLVSNGGDPNAAWRFVSLIRERVKDFNVLVPEAAFSAATLIALGANKIVMHANGNLGPTDAQITDPQKKIRFGSEDLSNFLKYVREDVGITDQSNLLEAFKQFCEAAGPLTVAVAARGSLLSATLSAKLLGTHMKDKERVKVISEAFHKQHFHHSYPISRSEAKSIGLPIAIPDPDTERLMWKIWNTLAEDLQIRVPFSPLALLVQNPDTAPLFAPVPQLTLPSGVPPAFQQQVYVNLIQQALQSHAIPPTVFENVHAVMESVQCASRFVSKGRIYAARKPDLGIDLNLIFEFQGWLDDTAQI